MADAGKFQEQIKKIPYLVSFSSYMDETAMQSDLILPNHVYLERYEDVPVAAGLTQPVIGLARPTETVTSIGTDVNGLVGSAAAGAETGSLMVCLFFRFDFQVL